MASQTNQPFEKIGGYACSLGIILTSVFLSTLLHADTIPLKPGYWEYNQTTTVKDYPLPIPDLKGSECLLKVDSDNTLQHYVDKFRKGLGEDSHCDLSNVKHLGSKVSADLQCFNRDIGKSMHSMEYTYSPTRVDIKSKGTMSIGGAKFTTYTKAVSIWKRKCTEAEKQIEIEQTVTTAAPARTQPKAAFSIGPDEAGPVKSSLIFSRESIQKLFPSEKIKKTKAMSYGFIQTVYNVHKKGMDSPIFHIDGRQDTNAVFSVYTKNSHVAGPFGERIGKTQLGEVSSISPHVCSFGENNLKRTIVCLTNNKFRSLYTLPKNILDKYSDTIPQAEKDKAVLTEMRYFLDYPKNFKNYEKQLDKNIKVTRLDANNFYNDLKNINSEKPVLVHFTSTDGSCVHCIKNNSEFEDAKKKLGNKYNYREVVFNPWRTYLKKHKRLGGLPVVNIYIDNTELVKIIGNQKNLSDIIAKEHSEIKTILNTNYDKIEILKIESSSIKNIVEKQRGEKLLVIHITSTSSDCSACIKSNAFLRASYEQLGNRIDFLELIYDPYSTLQRDKELTAYLKINKLKVNGLPAFIFHKNGKFIGVRAGVWPTMEKDLKKFL